jgi:hypothetical protein
MFWGFTFVLCGGLLNVLSCLIGSPCFAVLPVLCVGLRNVPSCLMGSLHIRVLPLVCVIELLKVLN